MRKIKARLFKGKKRKNDKRKLNSVADYFIEHELYQLFVVDRTLWLFALLSIGVFIYKAVMRTFQLNHFFYGLMLLVGFTLIINVQFARVRRDQKILGVNRLQLIIFVVNVLIVTLVSIRFFRARPGDIEVFFDQWLICGWEQLIFGVVFPFVLLYVTRFARKNVYLEISLFIIVIGISSICFALLHIFVYGFELGTLLVLFITGLGLMAICYSISPSLSWSLHLLNNLLLLSKITT